MHISLLLHPQNVFSFNERASTKCEKKGASLNFSSISPLYHYDLRVTIPIKLNRYFVIYPPHPLAYMQPHSPSLCFSFVQGRVWLHVGYTPYCHYWTINSRGLSFVRGLNDLLRRQQKFYEETITLPTSEFRIIETNKPLRKGRMNNTSQANYTPSSLLRRTLSKAYRRILPVELEEKRFIQITFCGSQSYHRHHSIKIVVSVQLLRTGQGIVCGLCSTCAMR